MQSDLEKALQMFSLRNTSLRTAAAQSSAKMRTIDDYSCTLEKALQIHANIKHSTTLLGTNIKTLLGSKVRSGSLTNDGSKLNQKTFAENCNRPRMDIPKFNPNAWYC